MKMFLAGFLLLTTMDYPHDCYCQPGNCHPVPCDELHRNHDSWLWQPKHPTNAFDWQPRFFWSGESKTLPSGDGQCHVCHWETGNSERGLCVFVPEGES